MTLMPLGIPFVPYSTGEETEPLPDDLRKLWPGVLPEPATAPLLSPDPTGEFIPLPPLDEDLRNAIWNLLLRPVRKPGSTMKSLKLSDHLRRRRRRGRLLARALHHGRLPACA